MRPWWELPCTAQETILWWVPMILVHTCTCMYVCTGVCVCVLDIHVYVTAQFTTQPISRPAILLWNGPAWWNNSLLPSRLVGRFRNQLGGCQCGSDWPTYLSICCGFKQSKTMTLKHSRDSLAHSQTTLKPSALTAWTWNVLRASVQQSLEHIFETVVAWCRALNGILAC